jgi:hypothetical protein
MTTNSGGLMFVLISLISWLKETGTHVTSPSEDNAYLIF